MTLKVSILTKGLARYKSRAFLLPIYKYRKKIESEGVELSISQTYSNIDLNCDCLIVDSQFFNTDSEKLSKMNNLSGRVNRLLYFDMADGTGSYLMPKIIKIVDGYYKKQLLRNKQRYCEPMWDCRIHADYYYSNGNISPKKEETGDISNSPLVESESDLRKLGVFWNLGYEVYLPFFIRKHTLFKWLPERITKRLPWETIQSAPGVWVPPEKSREIPISGRFSTSYSVKAVEYHRELMIDKIKRQFQNDHISTFNYWQELRNAKVLMSPFGLGEVCHRDFEGFLSGCLLIKPRMDHLKTWPPLYQDGKTMLAVNWDMSDLEQTVDWVLAHPSERRAIAREGQQRYQRYIVGESAADLFVDRFMSIISE